MLSIGICKLDLHAKGRMLIERRAVHRFYGSVARVYTLVVYEDKILRSSFDVVDLAKTSKNFADIVISHWEAAVATMRHSASEDARRLRVHGCYQVTHVKVCVVRPLSRVPRTPLKARPRVH